MYGPFEKAIDAYPEVYKRDPDHLTPPEEFEERLVDCDECDYRVEVYCTLCKCRGKRCIRMAELGNCPLG